MAESDEAQIVTENVIGTGYVFGDERSHDSVSTARARNQKPSRAHLRSHCVLVIGAADRAEEFLVPLMTSLASPVVYLDATNPTFSHTSGGTLIVRNVEGLTPRDQGRFLDWLNAQQELTRVIAISPRSLFPRVRRGAFSEQLYYRLNMVIVDLAPR